MEWQNTFRGTACNPVLACASAIVEPSQGEMYGKDNGRLGGPCITLEYNYSQLRQRLIAGAAAVGARLSYVSSLSVDWSYPRTIVTGMNPLARHPLHSTKLVGLWHHLLTIRTIFTRPY
jgi:hypothetical protein